MRSQYSCGWYSVPGPYCRLGPIKPLRIKVRNGAGDGVGRVSVPKDGRSEESARLRTDELIFLGAGADVGHGVEEPFLDSDLRAGSADGGDELDFGENESGSVPAKRKKRPTSKRIPRCELHIMTQLEILDEPERNQERLDGIYFEGLRNQLLS